MWLQTGGFRSPSLRSGNSLEWLTEHRGIFYAPDYWFIIIDRTQELQYVRDAWDEEWGKGSFSKFLPSMPFSPISTCLPAQESSLNLTLFGFLWELHSTGMIKAVATSWTQSLAPLPPPPAPPRGRHGGRTASSNHKVGSKATGPLRGSPVTLIT